MSNNIPDTAAESAALVNLSTPYAVNLTAGVSIAEFFGVSGTTLNINNAAALTIGGATFSNQGVVVVNSNGAGNATFMNFTGGATLSGPGAIRLNATSGVLDRAYMTSSGGFTNGGGHTIRGRGNIYNSMTNNGTIVADEAGETLQVLSGAKVNNNFMRATNGGVLQMNGGSINQSGGGTIQADGGTVNLIAGTNIIGGTMSAFNGGVINVTAGSATLTGVAVSGPMTVQNNNALTLPTGIANNGTITVNPTGGGNQTYITFADGQVINGGGQIVLNATSAILDRSYIISPNGPSGVTNSLGHTIRGRGNIYYRFNNGGVVRGDVAGETLQMRDGVITNSGTLEAALGGNLSLLSVTVNQTPGGQINSSGGGNVLLSSATIAGGTLNATLPSRIIGVSGTQTLNAVTLNGAFDIQNNTSVAVLNSLVHTGTLTVNSQAGGNVTSLQPATGAVLSGNGEILLNASANVLDRAQLYSPSATPGFTNAAGHTVNGSGNIYYNVTNNGTIRANLAGRILQLLSGTVTNNSRLEATAGDLHVSSATVNQGSSGQIVASGGNVNLFSSTIRGGTVSGLAANRVANVSGTTTLDGVTLAGRFDVDNATSVNLPAAITNNGTLRVNANGGGNPTYLSLASGASVGGAGSILLNATSGVLDRAYVNVTAGSATNLPGHTIGGVGRIYGNMLNRGVISPGSSAGLLEHMSGTLTQAADGVINIELGGTGAGQSDLLGGSGAKVLGGTLNLTYLPGFQLGQCQTITIITGPSITGRFATVNAPAVELGFISIIYNPTSVVVSYVPSDYNGDGFPDFFDYDDYVNCFESGNCPEGTTADFNRDGFVDFFDYDAFVAAFENGC